MTFFRKDYPKPKKQDRDFQVLPARVMRHRLSEEIEIFLSEAAGDVIRQHPKCPFYKFAWSGECEIDMQWYYIAANGSMFNDQTQIILLQK